MFYVELLTQPPQPKRVRQWTMSSGEWLVGGLLIQVARGAMPCLPSQLAALRLPNVGRPCMCALCTAHLHTRACMHHTRLLRRTLAHTPHALAHSLHALTHATRAGAHIARGNTLRLVVGLPFSHPPYWAVTSLSNTVQRLPHPMAGQALSIAATQALKLRVTMPSNVLVPDDPRVAAWDVVRTSRMACVV